MKKQFLPVPGRVAATLALVLLVLSAATASWGATAANTVLTNTATVNYNDALGNAQPPQSASVDVTVNLLAAAPTLSSPADVSITEGGNIDLSYTITANANGPDTYDFSSSSTDAGISAPTISTPSVLLGGTTLAVDALAGATVLTVPYDNDYDGDANAVNGIIATDTVVIAGVAYTVNAVAENAGSNTATLTLATGLTAGASAGTIIGERQTVLVNVASGTLSAPPAAGTHTVTTTATAQGGANPAATQGTPTVVTVTLAAMAITKEVSTDGGATFAASANAQSGSTLTYRIVVTNNGSGDATSVVITDPIPAFTSYVGGSAKASATATDTYAAAATTLTDAADADTYTGSQAAGASYSVGTLAPGASAALYFQVTID